MTARGIRSYMQIFSRFRLTWHRKVNFSTFSGKLTFQSTRNGPQNLPFCPGPLQDTFIIFPRYLTNIFFENIIQTIFSKKSKTENPKRRAPESDRDLSFQKLIWSHMGTHGTPWDPHGDPMGTPWGPHGPPHPQKHILPHMALEGVLTRQK